MNMSRTNWMILGFFIFYFFILQLLGDWQFRPYIDHGDWRKTFRHRLFNMPFSMLEYYLFYRWGAPLLFKKKFLLFVLAIIIFIIFVEVYSPLVGWIDWRIFHYPDVSKRNPMTRWDDYPFLHQSLQFTFINLFAITGFAYFVNMFKEEKIRRQLKEQHLQLELNYLKAQLHPHFFFNTLNNIYSLALYRSDKTAPVVERLSHIMRYIIYDGQKDTVPLEKEISFLQNFVALEKIRHEDNVPISFTVQGDTTHISVSPLLFMPLIENGFKHGVHNNRTPWLEASMLIENNEINFEVKNKFEESVISDEKVGGIGLENLRKRLELLYPGKHQLLIHYCNNQYRVNLTLQLL